ncbi:MAG: CFI-box-CTERM domain-containing protein [Nitrososphaerales archaeon]
MDKHPTYRHTIECASELYQNSREGLPFATTSHIPICCYNRNSTAEVVTVDISTPPSPQKIEATKVEVLTPQKVEVAKVEVLTPQKIEIAINVTMVFEAKVGEVEVKLPLATAPRLPEVKVVVDKALPEKVPIKFNLTRALEAGKVANDLILSIHDKSSDVKVSLQLPKNVEILAPQPVKCLNVKQLLKFPETPKGWINVTSPIDIGPSGIKFDKAIIVNFTYTDEAVKKLNIDEKRLTIAYYDEKAAKWVPLKSVVNAEENYVYAKVDHFTTFILVQKPLPAECKVSNLIINPVRVLTGQIIEINVDIANVGEEVGEYNLTLKVNGKVEASKVVSLLGGAKETIKFNLVKEQPGVYNVEIDGLKSTFTVEAPPSSKCIIATATYGSELTPEVQFLREFRDNVVLSTFAGSMFIKTFNAWYYSWSPIVAEAIIQNQVLKEAVKVLLYPLMGILKGSVAFIYPALSFNPELGIIVTGIVISSLIGVTYLTLPLTLLLIILKYKKGKIIKTVRVKALTMSWLSSLILTALSVAFSSSLATMLATATLVLTTLCISAWILAVKLIQRLP